MKLSSRNLITLLLAVPASGLDMSSSTKKFREALKQISNNSNFKDHALSVSSNVRGARQMVGKVASPFDQFIACGEATDEIDLEDFKGMDDDDAMEKYLMDGTCTMDMEASPLLLTCDLAKASTEYENKCKKQNGKLVTVSFEMCMPAEDMGLDSNRRKLQDTDIAMKTAVNNFPVCIAETCDDESRAILKGLSRKMIDEEVGMTCTDENPKAKFMLKKKKKKNKKNQIKVKKMTCGALAKKKPKVINKICYNAKYQDYSGGASAPPASQVCKATCKQDFETTVDEVPTAKFSVVEGSNNQKVMTCSDIEKPGYGSMWTCIQGFKDDVPQPVKKKGGKKASKMMTYGSPHEVCPESCSDVVTEILGGESGDHEESGDN